MSLEAKKSALFGSKGKNANTGSVSKAPSITPKPVTTSDIASGASVLQAPSIAKASISSSGIAPMSSAVKLKKIDEAKELTKKATDFLKTSVFQWSPDYLAAAPNFEQAADLYKIVGEYDLAHKLLLQAADCHENYGAITSAAITMSKAAAIASQHRKAPKVAANDYNHAAVLWATSGDLTRSAETLAKAAKEVEEIDIETAIKVYSQACDRLVPPETPKEQLSSIPPSILDIYRAYLRVLLLRGGSLKETFEVTKRLLEIYISFELEGNYCKLMLTITLLQLSSGDVILAEDTYLNEHLNNQVYIKSKECEVAEEFIQAFKHQDVERLAAAQRHVQLNYLDKESQNLARKLTLYRNKREEVKYEKLANDVSRQLEELTLASHNEEFVDVQVMDSIIEEDQKKVEETNEFAIDEQDEDEIDLA